MEKYLIVDTSFDPQDFENWKIDLFCSEIVECTEDELMARYFQDKENWVWDERANLNKNIDGIIIGFADLGFWNGRTTGAKNFGSNISNIIDMCSCDSGKIYADRYNIKSTLYHHDGQHYCVYRIAKTEQQARKIMELAEQGILTYDYFKKHTCSLRKHVADIYGW